jgi:ferric-dicitrate binding protein FerR (iron transport regulator)
MTDRELTAYTLIAAMAAALAAIVWWRRYQSYPQTYARQQGRRRKLSEARALTQEAQAEREEAS